MFQLVRFGAVFFEEEMTPDDGHDMTLPVENIPDDVEPEIPDA